MKRLFALIAIAVIVATGAFSVQQVRHPQVAQAACYAWGSYHQVAGGPGIISVYDNATQQTAGYIALSLWYRDDSCGYRIYGMDMQLSKGGQPNSVCQQTAPYADWYLGLRTIIGGVSHPWPASGTFTGWDSSGFTTQVVTTSNVLLASAHLTVDNAWSSTGTQWLDTGTGCIYNVENYYNPQPYATYMTYTR